MRVIRSQKFNFIILDRYSLCQAYVEVQQWFSIEMILSRLLSSFNEQHFFTCFLVKLAWLQYLIWTLVSWSTKLIIDLLKYKESEICQKISQFYMTYVLTNSTYVLTHYTLWIQWLDFKSKDGAWWTCVVYLYGYIYSPIY